MTIALKKPVVSVICAVWLLLALEPDAVGAPIPAAARKRYKRGRVVYKEGRFRTALTMFKRGAKLHDHPLFDLAIAQCHRRLGNLELALVHYRLYRARAPRSRFVDLDDKIAGLKRLIARKRARRVKARRKTAKGGPEHRAGAAKPAAPTKRGPATRASVPVTPTPKRATTVLLTGLPSDALFFVDGERVDASGDRVELAAGSHQLKVIAPGHLPWNHRIFVRGERQRELRVTLLPEVSRRSSPWLVAGIATAGAVVVAEVAAIAFTVKANGELRSSPEFATSRNVAVASHIIAALAATGSIVSWIFYLRKLSARRHSATRVPAMRSAIEFRLVPAYNGAWAGASLSF